MAHFAQLDESNLVVRTIVVNNEVILVDGVEVEQVGKDFCRSLYGQDTNWVQCSYNENFRAIFPSHGDSYDPVNDVFVSNQIV